MDTVNYCCVTQAAVRVPRYQVPVREYTKKTHVTWEIVVVTRLFSLIQFVLAKQCGRD